MTMNFTDYGKAVDISAPPAADVVDFATLGKGGTMGGSMGSFMDGAPKAS